MLRRRVKCPETDHKAEVGAPGPRGRFSGGLLLRRSQSAFWRLADLKIGVRKLRLLILNGHSGQAAVADCVKGNPEIPSCPIRPRR